MGVLQHCINRQPTPHCTNLSYPFINAMTGIAAQRLQREFAEITSDKEIAETGIELESVDDSLVHYRARVVGPPDTPYATGRFELTVNIPDTYPFQPPVIKFATRIWHPNVSSQTGMICLDILKEQWAASMTLRTVLLSIRMLLSAPEPSDPQDAVVANQCLNNHQLFQATAQYWTQHFAGGQGVRNEDFEHKMQRLKEIAPECSQNELVQHLSYNMWSLEKATTAIFS